MSRGFNFPWVSTPFLGGNFSQWGRFPFINTSGPGGLLPGTNFENMFLLGSTHTLGGNPLRGMFGPGRSHAIGSTTIPGGTHSFGTSQPFGSMNIGGSKVHLGKQRLHLPPSIHFLICHFLSSQC
jgi:hypothetical protein